jgi:hypothetical protein
MGVASKAREREKPMYDGLDNWGDQDICPVARAVVDGTVHEVGLVWNDDDTWQQSYLRLCADTDNPAHHTPLSARTTKPVSCLRCLVRKSKYT